MDCPSEEEVMFMRSVLDQGLDVLNLSTRLTLYSIIRAIPASCIAHNLISEGIKQERAFRSMTSEALLKAYDISDSSHYLLRISPESDRYCGIAFSSFTLKPSTMK